MKSEADFWSMEQDNRCISKVKEVGRKQMMELQRKASEADDRGENSNPSQNIEAREQLAQSV